MKKQADWKESLKNFLQEHRQAVGVAAAAGAGGLIGGTFLPGLIYKKPTWGSRFMLGGGSAALTTLAVMAALGKGEDIPTPGAKPLKEALSTIKEVPGSLAGGMPTAKQFQNMGSMQRALYGKEGQGVLSWVMRQLKRDMPSYKGLAFRKSEDDTKREKAGLQFPTSDYSIWDSIGAYGGLAGGLGAGYGTQKLLGGMAQRYNRAEKIAQQILKARQGKNFSNLDSGTKLLLNKIQRTAGRGGVRNLYDMLKSYGILAGNKILPSKWKPAQTTVDRAVTNLKFNPFTMRAAASDAKITNPMLHNLAQAVAKKRGLHTLAETLGENRNTFNMLPARGLKRLGRLGRRGLPVLVGLMASGMVNHLTGANRDYDAMVSQKLYQDMNK